MRDARIRPLEAGAHYYLDSVRMLVCGAVRDVVGIDDGVVSGW